VIAQLAFKEEQLRRQAIVETLQHELKEARAVVEEITSYMESQSNL